MRARAKWVLLVVLVGVGGCKDFKKGFTEKYDTEFKASFGREFSASCTKGAKTQGDKAPDAIDARVATMCECMGKFLVEHRTTMELTKLSLGASTPESQTVIREAAGACKPSVDKGSLK